MPKVGIIKQDAAEWCWERRLKMWRAVMSPFGTTVMVGIVILLAVTVLLAFIGLRTVSGDSRRARKADALRKIEEVNRAGYVDDVGTIKIDRNKQRAIDEPD